MHSFEKGDSNRCRNVYEVLLRAGLPPGVLDAHKKNKHVSVGRCRMLASSSARKPSWLSCAPSKTRERATGPRRWAGQALAREAPRRGAACGVRFAGVVVPCGRCPSCVGGGNAEPDFAVGYPLETACSNVESRDASVRADLAIKRSGARAAVLMSDSDVARVKRALAASRQ